MNIQPEQIKWQREVLKMEIWKSPRTEKLHSSRREQTWINERYQHSDKDTAQKSVNHYLHAVAQQQYDYAKSRKSNNGRQVHEQRALLILEDQLRIWKSVLRMHNS